jgi:hypothetical protein
MTGKVYKTAQGKTVDLGTIILKNSHVRAVGNMNVNARGDQLDSNNRVIETKNRQIQRQTARTTVATPGPVHASTGKAKRASQSHPDSTIVNNLVAESVTESVAESVAETTHINPVTEPTPVETAAAAGGGLAAAIARSKLVKQEKEKTARQLAQSTPGVRKI